MILKRFLQVTVMGLSLMACNPKDMLKIEGKIGNGDKKTVYLEKVNVDKVETIDSTQLNGKGEFSFKTSCPLPTFYNIRIKDGGVVTIIGNKDKTIEIKGEEPNLVENYWVDGSESSLFIKVLNFQLLRTNKAIDSLQQTFKALPQEKTSDAKRVELAVELDSIVKSQIEFSKDFILEHATSLSAYYALYQQFHGGAYVLDPIRDRHSFLVVGSSLKAMYPESQYTKAILQHIKDINDAIKSQNIKQFIDNSETQLPAVALPNVKGDTLALKDVKGKLILLDFASLSAQGSKEYIDEMKKIYNKYKNRGLKIYMVCLENNFSQWQQRVKAMGITWDAVCETNVDGSRALINWNVRSIPANYIINDKKEIVGKNLTGQRLEDRIKDLLK